MLKKNFDEQCINVKLVLYFKGKRTKHKLSVTKKLYLAVN